jgi:Tol biopolymer transport system component
VALRLRIAIVVAVAGALLGVATGCGAKPAADKAGLLVYDVGTLNGTTGAGLWVVDDEGGHRRRFTGTPLPSSASGAAWSPKGGTILIWSDLAAEEEFWTIEGDGTDLRQVGRGSGATWSPDAREIAIVRGDDEISIVGEDGSPRRTIRLGLEKGEYADVLANWSPDGTRIALNANEPDTTAHVAVVAADGKSPAEVFRDEKEPEVSENFADWSPDGKSIAFIRGLAANEDGPVSAWVMRSDGSGRRLIAAHAGDIAFSTDGQSFLYVSGYPEKAALYRVPITGGERKRIGPAPKNGLIKDPLVEPGGRRVIDLLAGRLVVRDADGTARDLLTEPHEDRFPVWSPNGRQIAFVRGSEEALKGDVYLLDAAGKSERFVARNGSPVWLRDGRLLISRPKGFATAEDPDRIVMPLDGVSPAFSPDGRSIAFLRNRSEEGPEMKGEPDLIDVQSTLFVQQSDGTGVRRLAKSAGSSYQRLVYDAPVWAPDGQSIFIAQFDPGGGGSGSLHQISVAGGRDRTVARDLDTDFEAFAVSPDGQKVAFPTFDSIDVVRLDDLDRERIVTLDRVGAYAVKWSPNGEELAYVADDYDIETAAKLWVVDADGSDRRLVSRPGDAVNSFDWRPDGEPRESR